MFCVECGKVFKSYFITKTQKFCSSSCQRINYEKNNPEKIKKWRKEERERNKVKYINYGKNYRKSEKYDNNKVKGIFKEAAKNHKIKLKLDILSNYSNGIPKCNICNEVNIEFLTIDHIYGCSKELRKQQGTGHNLYRWLKNNNYPLGYQVLCWNCNCKKSMNKRFLESKYKYCQRRNQIIKFEVFSHYCNGIPYCQCCDEKDIDMLTIDHVNNDGVNQRKKYNYGTGIIFYKWLKNNRYPDDLGLKILCYNCNCSKQYNNGVCPHVKEK